MQGNWAVLFLLVVAVVVFALVKSRQKPEGEESTGENTETPEGSDASEGAREGAGASMKPESENIPGATPEPESSEVSWEDCQQQFEEEPPLEACDQVVFLPMDEADFDSNLVPETEVEPLPEFPRDVNAAIRREAWRLFRENYSKILLLTSFIVELNVIQRFVSADRSYVGLLVYLVLVVFSCLITLGAYRAAVQVYKGETLRPGMLVYFLKGRRFFPALGLNLLQAVAMLSPVAALIGVNLMMGIWASSHGLIRMTSAIIGGICFVMLLFLAVMTWMGMCVIISGFVMAHDPDQGAVSSFKAGFHLVNHNFGSVLGMITAAGWPLGIGILVVLISAKWAEWLLPVFILYNVLILLYGGYFILSMAGLANRLLPGADGAISEAAPAEGSPDDDTPIIVASAKDIPAAGITDEDAADTGEPIGGNPENATGDAAIPEATPAEAAPSGSADRV